MKYRDRFEEIEELGNVRMGRFMLTEVFTKMAKTCKECQRDRMRCTLRPLCPDRVFLNILISLGAKTSDLPSFCYQVHLRALDSYLRSGAKRDHPHEPRYPLRYFRRFVTFKKGDTNANFLAFAAYLEKTTGKTVHCYQVEDTWLYSVGNGIFTVDLDRQLVSLDPDGDIVRRPALEPLITFLTDIEGLEVEILKDLRDTWYLQIICPRFEKDPFTQLVKPQLEQLEEYWSFVRVHNQDKITQILVGLDPTPKTFIRLQSLRKTIKLLAEIVAAAPKKSGKEKRSKVSKKPTPSVEAVARPVSK